MSESKLPPNPALAQLLGVTAYVKRTFLGLSRAARIMFGVTAGILLLFGAFILFQKANEPYGVLFSQLDRDDASAIVTKLKELKVPYRLEGDGTTIEVEASKLDELRLQLAGGGLPRAGGVGFESFDKMRLGATDFEQRVLYRRALEGELTRTIATLGAIESSRVHLVLPEKSVFVTRSEPASASIVLRLHPGRSLGSSEVSAIVHLVSAAVPSLDPDHIAVVTTDGTTLHRPHKGTGALDDLGGGDDDVRAVAHAYETSVEDRVRAMLEKVVGPGHADVRVTAEIDSAHVEHLEEHFDPSKSALRSEEQSTERAAGEPDESVAGVPGAESNLPGGAARAAKTPKPAASAAAASASASASAGPPPSPPAAVAAGSVRESHTRNFEIDHVSEKRTSTGSSLRRLTVAVVLDGVRDGKGAARTDQDLQKLAMLARTAAGANDARGDIVTVEFLPFAESPDSAAEAAAPPSVPLTRLQMAKRWGPYAAGGVVLLVLLVVVAAKRGRRVAPPLPAPVLELAAVTQVPETIEAAIRPALDSGDLRTRAHSRAAIDPATAALVLRFWLGTSAPEPREAAKV